MMQQDYIDVPHKKWGIVVIHNFDVDEEYVELMAIMRSFGLTQAKAKKALDILSHFNTGMALSIDELRMSAIFVSKATTSSQWWDTAIHELKHVADAIINYYGVEWDSEDAAYLTGYLTKELVELVGKPCF